MSEEFGELSSERIGRVTASRIKDVTAKRTTAAHDNYRVQLIIERLLGISQDKDISYLPQIKHGKDTEPLARMAYSSHTDQEILLAGFVLHPSIPMSGASPDGLIGEEGLVEFKCPFEPRTHYETLEAGKITNSGYLEQVLWQLACTQRQWCDYVSFDPRWPPQQRLFIHRIERRTYKAKIAELETAVVDFLAEVDLGVARMR
jgi:hypothetical protein